MGRDTCLEFHTRARTRLARTLSNRLRDLRNRVLQGVDVCFS